jgi:RNA polymerase sigma factor (sigma-70 family)
LRSFLTSITWTSLSRPPHQVRLPYDGCERKDVTVEGPEWQLEQFEQHRSHLRGVAYRMLGSMSEAEDAVQEAWLRLDRSDSDTVENMRGWLTTVVGRICLDMLRTRRSRREELVGERLPEPVVSVDHGTDPEQEALLADSVGLALLVVLETLTPAERLAFVLHDMFALSFEEIAPIVERTPAATRQLASRARRRVRNAAPRADAELSEQRRVVDAFLAASRAGDFGALLEVLDPDVVFRSDRGGLAPGAPALVTGADAVARTVLSRGSRFAPFARPAVVNGAAGVVVAPGGRPIAVVGFTVAAGRVVAIDLVADPDKLRGLAF